MSSIYSSLPDPRRDLPETRSEFNELVNFLISDKIKEKVDFGYSEEKTVDELTSEIIKRQKELRLFHFGGHSGASGLQFTDAEFNEEHVSNFFNTICAEESNIECVFLNGCENENIVNKLSNVPVVIGTKSKIEDKVARKFTMDFITALIGGEKTYKRAYLIAQAAKNEKPQIVDRTGAMRGIKIRDNVEPLNDYFMVINKAGVADRKFPFKRGRINWTKYLLLFFVAVALFLGYLFYDSIERIVWGYTCAGIVPEEGKCNVVIGDFAADESLKFERKLELSVLRSPILQTSMLVTTIGSFEKNIHKKRVGENDLLSYCNYDFNLTGSLDKVGDKYSATFDIFPNVTGIPPDTFVYEMESLKELNTLTSTLDSNNANQFVLIEMCLSCARKNGDTNFISELNKQIEKFDPSHASPMYQRLQYSMADLNLYFYDTSEALVALDKMRSAVGNDLALLAVERKIDLYAGSNNILRTFETQSELISEMQARVQNPGKYELNADLRQYQVGENKVRLNRAEFVLKHQEGALKDFKGIAIQDLEYLHKIKFQDRDFSRELTQLKGVKTEDARTIIPKEKFHFKGRVLSESGANLEGVILLFGDAKTKTDTRGQFDFGTFSKADVIGKQLLISRQGFHDKKIEIKEETIGRIILKPNDPELQKYSVRLQAAQIKSKAYQKVLSELKSAGHPINTERSNNFTTIPENFSKTSVVIFYDNAYAERAASLAKQMQDWTGVNFKTVLASGTPATVGFLRAYAPKEDILIQWVNTKSITPPLH